MNSGKMVFSQIMDCLPWWRFHSIVKQYRGNHKSKHFSCAEHFRVMAFAQLTHRKSLLDVEAAFYSIVKKAYHMVIKCKIAKSTLADANEQRNWKIYADFSTYGIYTITIQNIFSYIKIKCGKFLRTKNQ